MSVTAVAEIWDSRDGSLNDEASREYTRAFRVQTNNPLDGPQTVRSGLGVAIFDTYVTTTESDVGAVVASIHSAQDQDDPYYWVVTVSYKTRSFDPEKNEENPLLRPPDVMWGTGVLEQAMAKDVDGNAIVNAVEDPFDPPVTRRRSFRTLTLTRNEASFDHAETQEYENTVNDDMLFGYDAECVLCTSITGSSAYENGGSYWKVTYEFEILLPTEAELADPDFIGPWQASLVNQGWRAIDPDSGTAEQVTDNGQPLTNQTFLDLSGLALDPGDPLTFLNFRKYPAKSFSDLSLTLL